eukprot:6183266-Pleurochrysis_carterae.AAC.4
MFWVDRPSEPVLLRAKQFIFKCTGVTLVKEADAQRTIYQPTTASYYCKLSTSERGNIDLICKWKKLLTPWQPLDALHAFCINHAYSEDDHGLTLCILKE